MLGILYIIAIALQLSGALILAWKYIPVSMEEMLGKLDSKRIKLEGETLVVGEFVPSDREYAEKVYLNRWAFLYIAFGYIVGMIGESKYSKVTNCAAVIILSIALILLTNAFISRVAGKKYGDR